MSKIKVMMVFHSIGYGGADKMFAYIANTLSKHQFEVSIYTYESNEEPHYQLENNIKVIKETKYFNRSNMNKIFQLLNTRRNIKRYKPDIVISFMSTSNFFSVIGTRFSGIPVLISERGNPGIERGFFSWIKQKTLIFSEAAVFQTEGAKEYFPKILQKKSRIIPNPVLATSVKVPPWDERGNEISFVSRFDIKQKRHDVVIAAFKKVSTIYPEYKLVFYGDGQDEPEVRKLVNNYSLNEKVIFKGKVNDVIKQIAHSKLFVMSSDFEGIPNALIEAMSLGLPCISTDCDPGGARFLIENHVNGILVPKGDSDALAEAIMNLLKNPHFADNLGQQAREINHEYSEEKIQQKWIEYIKNVVSK